MIDYMAVLASYSFLLAGLLGRKFGDAFLRL